MSRGALAALVFGLIACSSPDAPSSNATSTGAVDTAPGEVSAPAPSSGPAGDSSGPAGDIVLITLDTLRADSLGFAGHPEAETPLLDRLAAAGRVFEQAYAHHVVTLPSHANILTGLYPQDHGVRENSGYVLGPEVETLAERLQAAGFATGAFIGAFPLDARFGLDQGFDVYDDDYPETAERSEFRFAERRGDEVVGAALEWWRSQAGQRRFLWVHLYDPHAPYAAPEPYASRFAERPYLGEVAATDAFLAPLLEPILDAEADAARTLIIVTADHGESLGEHGEMTHGLFAYEATLKVPLVVRGPGIEPGREEASAGHVDIVPTVLRATGLDIPAELPGRPLQADLPGDRALYFEALSTYFNRGWAPLRGVVRGSTKMIELPIPELYDLAEDAAETSNLFRAERERFNRLRSDLPRETPWPPEQRAISSEEAAKLRSLGYLSSSGKRSTSFAPEDDPKNLIALDRKLHDLIDAYSRGDLESAVRLANEVVEERPAMGLGYEHLALVLRQMERPGQAIAVMRTAVERGVADPSLLRQLGLTLAENGLAGEAVEILTPLAGDGDPETLNALGIALSDAGRQNEAAEIFGRTLGADPDNVQALEGIGVAALRAGRIEDAERALRRALEINPQLPRSWNTLGVVHAQRGADHAAIGAWQRALELDPRLLDALYNIGLVAAKIGENATARQALERYVAVAPPQRFAADIARAREILASLGG